MDLSNAFDYLPRGLLITKLRARGLPEMAVKLLHSYLNERIQQIRFESHTSSWEKLFKGIVPQGYILLPLLFDVLFIYLFIYFILVFSVFYTVMLMASLYLLVIKSLLHALKSVLEKKKKKKKCQSYKVGCKQFYEGKS